MESYERQIRISTALTKLVGGVICYGACIVSLAVFLRAWVGGSGRLVFVLGVFWILVTIINIIQCIQFI